MCFNVNKVITSYQFWWNISDRCWGFSQSIGLQVEHTLKFSSWCLMGLSLFVYGLLFSCTVLEAVFKPIFYLNWEKPGSKLSKTQYFEATSPLVLLSLALLLHRQIWPQQFGSFAVLCLKAVKKSRKTIYVMSVIFLPAYSKLLALSLRINRKEGVI